MAATAQMRRPLKVVGNEGEGKAEHNEAVWAQYLRWKVPIVLTDHAQPLIEYLKTQTMRQK